MTDVDVIGAGLSGLATAWYLTEAGARVHLHETASRPGGLIQTSHAPQGLVENAARAFIWSPRVEALFAAAGVESCATRRESRRRYVFRDGRPRRWPLSAPESAVMAARLSRAWIGRGMRPTTEETVESWSLRVLGTAATTWLIGPVMQGVYASPPGRLSASATIGGQKMRGPLVAPKAGMGALMTGLLEGLRARGATCTFGAPVDRLRPGVPTVICTDAPSAARLLAPHAPAAADAIRRIQTVALASATAFFEPHPSDTRGFGILFPRSSGVRALGVLFNTDMFPDRGDARSETWIYGAEDAGALPLGEADMAAAIALDRRVLTGRNEAPAVLHVSPAPLRLPLYDDAVLRARAATDDLPDRLAVTGNYLGNLGVSKLVESAASAARRLTA